MIKKKTWKEFTDIGLLWLINQTLHLFERINIDELEKEANE